jgi:NmrA-like family
MATPTYIRNVAIVGVWHSIGPLTNSTNTSKATGNLGSLILQALLSTDARFNVTALTRSTSTATFPPGTEDRITILKGDYDSPNFLSLAFTGQDALLLVLHGSAIIQPQIKLIEAAADAGVKWILPTEYGTDSANMELTNAVPINSVKVPAKLHLETLTTQYEGMKWIGVVTNLWFDLVWYDIIASFPVTWKPQSPTISLRAWKTAGWRIGFNTKKI